MRTIHTSYLCLNCDYASIHGLAKKVSLYWSIGAYFLAHPTAIDSNACIAENEIYLLFHHMPCVEDILRMDQILTEFVHNGLSGVYTWQRRIWTVFSADFDLLQPDTAADDHPDGSVARSLDERRRGDTECMCLAHASIYSVYNSGRVVTGQ